MITGRKQWPHSSSLRSSLESMVYLRSIYGLHTDQPLHCLGFTQEKCTHTVPWIVSDVRCEIIDQSTGLKFPSPYLMSLQQKVQVLLNQYLHSLTKLPRDVHVPSQQKELPQLEEAMKLPLY